MFQLSWNEIRQNAIQFARDWEGVTGERAEAQTFWNEFFKVFGLRRRTVASFEAPVRTIKDTYGRIDLFWRGRLLGEHKSATQTLDRAESQAFQYIQDLKSAGREDEIPQFVVLSNFRRIALYDLEPDDFRPDAAKGREAVSFAKFEFELRDFHKNVQHFAFIIGQKTHRFGEEDPANIKAAEIMAGIHDSISERNYDQAALERLLVRLLFCLFAEDTGIFEPNQFSLFLQNRTNPDGADLGAQLNGFFDILNTSPDRRPAGLDETLAEFPYVNGELFSERLPLPPFDRAMRTQLLAACDFDWSRISPAIFGSLFQGIMNPKERRSIGAHYTSERDILKLIRPLFLDDLRQVLADVVRDRSTRRLSRLYELQERLAGLKFLDPACGCGNFLVIAYRELRLLEMEVLGEIAKAERRTAKELDLGEAVKVSQVDVHQFYGIEIGEWPARIAETALWLTDHQMNLEMSKSTGTLFQRIPLKESPHIRCANALQTDWADLLPPAECSFILGNPPFIGAKYQSAEQREDVARLTGNLRGRGLLDYVTMWYLKAAAYMRATRIRCAFVSTNSISQGEQVGVLWEEMFRLGVKIHFAHRTFAWQSEARGKAHVHVIIIGFGMTDSESKIIWHYEDIQGEPVAVPASNIAPYLIEGGDTVITNRSRPLCDVPRIGIGNKPIDGGHYLFTEEEKQRFLVREPGAERFFRPWIGSDEFLHGYQRWCLWLGEASPAELNDLPECRKRVEAVRAFRSESRSEPTRAIADRPRSFHVENFPRGNFMVIPKVSSERRLYIPIGYVRAPVIVSDLCFISENGNAWHFGVLTSRMHMAWMRQVCGRLESRYRYSAKLVYNNFPWPAKVSPRQRAKVEECAAAVLAAREPELRRGSTLSDLYDPVLTPSELTNAHRALDRAVDRCYRKEKFNSDRERVEFLFRLYEELVSPLAPSEGASGPATGRKRAARKSGGRK